MRGMTANGLALASLAVAFCATSCSSNTQEPALMYLTSLIGPTFSGPLANTCPIDPANPKYLVEGSPTSALSASAAGVDMLDCSVTPSGSSFAVSVSYAGGDGSFNVAGTLPATGSGTMVTASIEALMSGVETAVFQDTNCTVQLADKSTPEFPGGPPIKPGAAWATLTCNNMTTVGQPGHQCQGVITFRIENCMGSPSM